MNTLKVSTKDPQKLKDEINEKIMLRQITSWDYDDVKDCISHKGTQYRGHFYFTYQIDDPKGILEFLLHSSGSAFAESRAPQLLERMLATHFYKIIEIL